MSTITKSQDVHAAIDRVYNQWTQFETFPQFMGGVEQVDQTDDRHLHWRVNIAGVAREFDAEITEQHPEERVAWKATGDTEHAGVVTFHKLGDQDTRVTVQLEWRPDSTLEKVAAAVNVDDRQVAADLQRFKSFLENTDGQTGAWRGDVPREG